MPTFVNNLQCMLHQILISLTIITKEIIILNIKIYPKLYIELI